MKWYNRSAFFFLIAMSAVDFHRHSRWWIPWALLAACNLYFHWGVRDRIKRKA